MGKACKALSVVLIIASLFGLAGGSLALKDALGSKEYWENASSGGDSIGMLEDGLNQLKANEQAYLDGRDALAAGEEAYAEGVKTLEEGQAAFEEGKKTLEEKQGEFDAGLEKLADARTQLLEGRAKLQAGQEQYNAGMQTFIDKQAEYEAGVAQLDAAKAQLASLQQGLQTANAGLQQLQAANTGLKKVQAALAAQGINLPDPGPSNADGYESAITGAISSIESQLAGLDYNTLVTQKSQLEAAIEQTLAADPSADVSAYRAQLTQVEAGIAGFESLAALQQAKGVPTAAKAGYYQLVNGYVDAYNSAAANPEIAAQIPSTVPSTLEAMKSGAMTYDQFIAASNQLLTLFTQIGSAVQQKIAEGEKALADGAAQLAAGEATLAAARGELEKGIETYRSGYAQYRYGKEQLEEGAVLLEEGREKLDEAAKQLEDGKAQLADAEQQLADGKSQLAEFEDGRKQVIDGLNTAISTPSYEGVESIAERLGEGFSFMKNETDLDIDKGLEVVAAARAFAADTTEAVTKEITSKAIGSVVAIAGAAIALIGGVLGLLMGKPAGAGVVALLGGIAAVVGVIMSGAAGNVFSQMAGASGPALLTAAGAVTGAAAVPQAISAFTAKAPAKVAE